MPVLQQPLGDEQDAAGGDGDGDCSQRFGVAIGQPVETGDADEDAERFTDGQFVDHGHQRQFCTGIVASFGCAGSSPKKWSRAAARNWRRVCSLMFFFLRVVFSVDGRILRTASAAVCGASVPSS